MSYRFKCRTCKEFVYLREIQKKNTNYPCSNCNSANWISGKYTGFKEIDENEWGKSIKSIYEKNLMANNIPDKVPQYCNADCKYYSGLFKGKCSFYNEDVTGGYDCIATRRFGAVPGRFQKMPEVRDIECPNCNKPQNDNAVY